jgi:flagellar biosynthesis protein FliQ
MKNKILILGDVITLLIVTLIGFATHGETSISFSPRILTIFIPLIIAWFLLAPWFGLFNTEINSNLQQLWRPALTMLFADPLAVVLRGLILNAPIIPIFAVVLSATSALGMMIWRMLYLVLNRKDYH